jgi:hypothetical protein
VPTSSVQEVQKRARDFGVFRTTPGGLVVPRNAIPFQAVGAVVCPALGTQVVVCTYQVQPQWFALVWGVVFQFVGTPAALPNDITWTVDVDRPLGAVDQGYAEKDYGAVPILLGDNQDRPWPVNFRHWSKETLRVKGTPNTNVTPGGSNFLVGMLLGDTWPGQGWES